MRLNKLISILAGGGKASAIVCAGLWLAGCATAGYTKGDATARSLQRASYEVTGESRALDTAIQSLRDLVEKPGADLKPQYQQYSAALDRLIASAERNHRADQQISQRSAAYFQAWDKQLESMNYEVVREHSLARKAEATNDFESVHQRYVEAQTVMQPFLAYLQDIRRALNADLTQRGLEELKPIVANADENAAKVQTALSKLSNELAASGGRLSSYAYQTTGSVNVSPTGTNSGRATLRDK